jgi:MFS family permease
MLSPAALSIITTAFDGQQRAKALAAWGAIGGAGAAIGVLLGGILTEVADWRTIFFVNLPLAIALATAATKIVPADTKRRVLERPGSPRCRPGDLEHRRHCLGDHSGRPRRLDLGRDAHLRRRRDRRSRTVSRLGAPH